MMYVRPAKPQISLRIWASDQSLCLSLEYSLIVKLLTEHHLEFLSLKGGCRGSSESTFVKMPHCWKSHVTTHFIGVVCRQMIYKYQTLTYLLVRRMLIFNIYSDAGLEDAPNQFSLENSQKLPETNLCPLPTTVITLQLG